MAMVKIVCDKDGTYTMHQGDPIEVAIYVALAVGNIYNNLKTDNAKDAEFFQRAMQRLLQPESDVWENDDNVTRIVVSAEKQEKGGAPTDQS